MQYDPVTLDIIWNRLISICDEAETGLQRTAFSPIVREGKDFCCVLLDIKGNSIAQGSLSLPIFLASAPLTAQKILEKFPAETLEPGDIVVTNNPWVNAGHLHDVFTLEPIYRQGKLVALAASVAHWADCGGRGESPTNRSIFEEGIQVPILKIAKRGQFNDEVMEIIRENVRFPEMVTGDFQSQLIGNNLIRTKVVELIEGQGIEDFEVLGEAVLSRSEAAMRNAIAKVPDGVYTNHVLIDGIDRDLTLKVKVSVRGTDIDVDFAGSSPQTEWAINSMPNFSYAYSFIGLKAAVAPHFPNNSGQMRPVTMSFPLGSIVNPRPRSVGAEARNVVGNFCCPAVFGALARALPGRIQADSPPMDNIRIVGESEDGTAFQFAPTSPCGMGARYNGDGLSGVLWPTGIRSRTVEMTEYLAPSVMFQRKEIKADSGAPGRYRGGCGLRAEVRIMDKASAMCHVAARGIRHQAQGLLGGHAGAASCILLNGEPIPGLGSIPLKHGDHVSLTTAGGGGYGDPLERDPNMVLDDVLDGLVSHEQAKATYGVVIDPATKTLDPGATSALRQSRQLKEADLSGTRPG